METPRRYAPMGGSFAPVRVAGFKWNGWQTSAVYAPEIPWRMIIATRNRLIHAYLGIDDDTIWSIIQDDLPALLAGLRKIVEEV